MKRSTSCYHYITSLQRKSTAFIKMLNTALVNKCSILITCVTAPAVFMECINPPSWISNIPYGVG